MPGLPLFPDHVEFFVEQLDKYLGLEDVHLSLVSESPEAARRDYEVRVGERVANVIIHRTADTLTQPVGRYRARVFTPLPDELAAWFKGKEDVANRCASLAALVTTEKNATVYSQCLIEQDHIQALTAMLASAAIHGASCIVSSIQKAVSQNEEQNHIKTLSAWSDIDFETLRYDLAHYGLSSSFKNGTKIALHPRGSLEILATHQNPYWGGGLLGLLFVPGKHVDQRASDISANDLNFAEFFFGDWPMLGAWCKDNDDFVFVSFAPNHLKMIPEFTPYFVHLSHYRFYKHLDAMIEVALTLKKNESAEVAK